MSISWSYAAALHLGLDPSVVFQANGYPRGSQSPLDNFANDQFIGLPMLQWAGLTADLARACERSRTGRRALPAHVAMDRRVNHLRQEPRTAEPLLSSTALVGPATHHVL